MKITCVEHGLELLHQSTPRSTGIHMSDLYNSLYAELEPTRYGGTDGPNVVKMALGLAWETHLEKCLSAAGLDATRPDEGMTDEGIAFSPDLLIFNSHTRVGEIKCTWASSRDTPKEAANSFSPKFDKWLTQIKAYCRVLGLSDARLIVLFVNGDYSQPYTPQLLSWDITFTERELDDNWAMLLNFARHKGLL